MRTFVACLVAIAFVAGVIGGRGASDYHHRQTGLPEQSEVRVIHRTVPVMGGGAYTCAIAEIRGKSVTVLECQP